jgi:predicted DCC family thiol-disulfide oxidoreductase YuxK
VPDAGREARLVVLYDLDCGVCVAVAGWLTQRDLDGRLELLPLQRAASSGRPVLERIATSHDLHAELHVVDEASGRIQAGGRAMTEILGRLPGGRLIAAIGRLPLFAWLIGLGYALVARNRRAISRALRLERACVIPRPRDRSRPAP